MESRASYGYGATIATPKKDIEKYMVAYRTDDGGYGELGIGLFKTEQAARVAAEKFFGDARKRSEQPGWGAYSWGFVKEIIIKHPAAIQSGY